LQAFGNFILSSSVRHSVEASSTSKVLKQLNARRHDEADRQEFANIVATFASYIPMPEAPDLLKHLALAYEGSLGLVGCFKPWLNRAVARALDRGSRVLSEQDLTARLLLEENTRASGK